MRLGLMATAAALASAAALLLVVQRRRCGRSLPRHHVEQHKPDNSSDPPAAANGSACTGAARSRCTRCDRPSRVCLCDSLPATPLRLGTPVIVLQHRRELKRKVQSGCLLRLCLERCAVITGRSYDRVCRCALWPDSSLADPQVATPLLTTTIPRPTPLLLFPRPDGSSLTEIASRAKSGERCTPYPLALALPP